MKIRKDRRLRQSIAMALVALAALPTVSHADDGDSNTSDSDSSRGPDVTVIGSTYDIDARETSLNTVGVLNGTTFTSLPIVSLVNPEYLSRPANSVTTRGNLAETTAKSYAAYVNDTLSLTAEWKIVAGAR